MASEIKLMISARLPAEVIARVDFVARNHDSNALTTRSAVILAAIESWLPSAEKRLRDLGVMPPARK